MHDTLVLIMFAGCSQEYGGDYRERDCRIERRALRLSSFSRVLRTRKGDWEAVSRDEGGSLGMPGISEALRRENSAKQGARWGEHCESRPLALVTWKSLERLQWTWIVLWRQEADESTLRSTEKVVKCYRPISSAEKLNGERQEKVERRQDVCHLVFTFS